MQRNMSGILLLFSQMEDSLSTLISVLVFSEILSPPRVLFLMLELVQGNHTVSQLLSSTSWKNDSDNLQH